MRIPLNFILDAGVYGASKAVLLHLIQLECIKKYTQEVVCTEAKHIRKRKRMNPVILVFHYNKALCLGKCVRSGIFYYRID